MAFDKVGFLLALTVAGCAWRAATAMAIDGDYADDSDEGRPFFSVVAAKQILDDDVDAQPLTTDAAAPCCLPQTWQGTLTSMYGIARVGGGGGGPGGETDDGDDDVDVDKKGGKSGRGKKRGRSRVVASVDEVFVDETNKRIAGRKVATHKHKTANIAYIVLFNASAGSANLYVYDNVSQKCLVRDLKKAQFRPQCIPANATLIGTVKLGMAETSLTVQKWGIHHESKREDLDEETYDEDDDVEGGDRPPKPPRKPRPHRGGSLCMELLVIPGICIPVLQQEVAHQGDVGLVGSVFFSDMQTTIADPSVFTPPAYCRKPRLSFMTPGEDDVPEVFKRFIL